MSPLEQRPPGSGRRGIIFVISAPSGAGKTTLSRRAAVAFADLFLSVSYTTRPPRAGEADGRDYHFVDEERFRALREGGALAEWAEVHGFTYGTPRAPLEDALGAGTDVLLDIDVQGARRIKSVFPEAVSVFILPPSWEELERRLRRRRSDDAAAIARRLKRAREEAEELPLYDYLIRNDDLETAVGVLTAIITAERARVCRIVPPARGGGAGSP